MPNFMARFSPQANEVLLNSQAEAENRKHNSIDTDHLLLALVKLDSSVGAPQILRDCGATYDTLSNLVGINPYATTSKRLELSRDAKRTLEFAVAEMKRRNDPQITPEHLLIGILQIEDSAAVELLFRSHCEIKYLYAKMDVSLPSRVIQQHQQAQHQVPADESVDYTENEGCLPALWRSIRNFFKRDKS